MNELSEIIKIKPFNHQLVGAKLALRTFTKRIRFVNGDVK